MNSLFKIVTLLFIILLAVMGVYASTITVTSLPSASNTGLAYSWTTNHWLNFCPNCGAHDSLTVNPKNVEEQELTCSICDSDFCGSSGKEKGYIGSYLTRANVFIFPFPIIWNHNFSAMEV